MKDKVPRCSNQIHHHTSNIKHTHSHGWIYSDKQNNVFLPLSACSGTKCAFPTNKMDGVNKITFVPSFSLLWSRHESKGASFFLIDRLTTKCATRRVWFLKMHRLEINKKATHNNKGRVPRLRVCELSLSECRGGEAGAPEALAAIHHWLGTFTSHYVLLSALLLKHWDCHAGCTTARCWAAVGCGCAPYVVLGCVVLCCT